MGRTQEQLDVMDMMIGAIHDHEENIKDLTDALFLAVEKINNLSDKVQTILEKFAPLLTKEELNE